MAYMLNVYALPRLAEPEDFIGGSVVVIDVLRSTTTIVYALEAGAREVIPCAEVEEARACAEKIRDRGVLLGGERQGLPLEGFDLGNSPEEYTPERVAGKTIVLTTTNGTHAMAHARQAGRILIGALVNATAVCEQLLSQERIHLLCSGTDGQFSQDDILLAGLLVERIQRLSGLSYELNAQAITAREFWLHRFATPRALGAEPLELERLTKELCRSLGGKNLVTLGLEADIRAAAQVDRFQSVPELDPASFTIRLP
jgi:2-phosphosulfolactate phosphatase